MRLDDYIREIQEEKKPKKQELYFSALELSNYPNISSKKKELLESVFEHISKERFMDAVYMHERSISEYAYYQSYSKDGTRGLVRVKICDLMGSYDIPEKVGPSKFYAEYNRGPKIGEQKYTFIKIQTYYDRNDPEFSRYMTIFYTADGKVFIDSYAAGEIEKKSETELGRSLAYKCIELDKEKERYRSRRR